jgi:glycerol-3-phosphate dehydrogenase
MGGVIRRDPEGAAAREHDLIVVGGGIYGVCVTLEAARRGLRPLLLERGDFGERTSWNSLRIVHGGLRYLQSLDLARFRESVSERTWFLEHYPELVRPLPCVMPLYGRGLKRPAVLSAALRLNDWLSRNRNDGVEAASRIPDGRVLSAAETVERFPSVSRDGLRGAAAWSDAFVPDTQRLLIELLRWACACGASALNYVEATELIEEGGAVRGVRGKNRESDATHEYRAPVVVNCGGPWVREIAARFDRDARELFVPSLALNLLLDRDPPSESAVAVAPPEPGGRVYFVVPWKGRTFAGTFHAPGAAAPPPDEAEEPGESLVREFLAELDRAIPAFGFREEDVLRVHWGRLPVTHEGGVDLKKRPVLQDHGAHGGPRGLFSVSGIKFTTARRVAEKTLESVSAEGVLMREVTSPQAGEPPRPSPLPDASRMRDLLSTDPVEARAVVQRAVSEESVVALEDLLLRRTDWGVLPHDSEELAPLIAPLLAEIRHQGA